MLGITAFDSAVPYKPPSRSVLRTICRALKALEQRVPRGADGKRIDGSADNGSLNGLCISSAER